jgi:AcrR family transcriptional regulator
MRRIDTLGEATPEADGLDDVTDATTAPRVRRRRERTRRKLLDAARTVIAERGVEALRLRDITSLADVGFASFYHHFPDKAALVDAVFAETIETIATETIASAETATDVAEAVAIAHRRFIRTAASDPSLARLVVQLDGGDAAFAAQVSSFARPVFERGVTEGRFTIDDLDTMLAFVVGATLSVIRTALAGGLPDDVDERSARVLLRACGLAEQEAAEISARPLPPTAPGTPAEA